MQEKQKRNRLDTILYLLFLFVYAGALIFLYYNQLTHEGIGPFESDTVVHYKMGAEQHYFYSFSSYLYYLFGLLPFGRAVTAVFLAFVSVITVYLSRVLLDRIFVIKKIELSDYIINVLSVCLNFVMAFYVRAAHYKHYIGYQSGNNWHNSTFTLMKFFSILTILVFLRVYESYRERLTIKEWLLLAGCLMVASGIKSSFLTVFAPLMAIMLLINLFEGTRFSKVLIMGCTILPSIAVLAWQSFVLFDDGGSSVAIAPFKVLSERSSNPKITVILSVLFPALVFLFHIKDFFRDKIYLGSLIMTFFGFVWVFFLTETGTRAVDGNFMWGYSISLFFLFIMSTVKVIEDISNPEIAKWNKYLRLAILLPVFAWHFISGVWFFTLLLQGNTYFI